MLNGGILYKNIFCIYPPLGYLINELLSKIFGVNLNVLYFAGLFSTMCIFALVYNITRMFFDKLLSFGILFFLISACVLSPNVFNMFLPYSFGILYGLLFALGSIYSALNKKFPAAYLLCSLAICSKAEFLFLLPALFYISGKDMLKKNLIAFIIPFFATLGILLLQGAKLTELKLSFDLIRLIANSATLHNFYYSMGLIPSLEHIPLYITNFIKFILPFSVKLYQTVLIWAFPLILCLFIFRYKNLNKNERFIIIVSLLISIKVFAALTLQSYGVYFAGFALISLGILLGNNKLRKGFSVLLIVWALIVGYNNSKILSSKSYALKTDKGTVKVIPDKGDALNKVLNYLQNTPANTTVAIYPEGLSVNFLSNRKSDNKFYSLIPLYVEVFGEDNIQNRIELFHTDYIIITDFDTKEYGWNRFGVDYGTEILKAIEKYYVPIEIINNGKYKIYSYTN